MGTGKPNGIGNITFQFEQFKENEENKNEEDLKFKIKSMEKEIDNLKKENAYLIDINENLEFVNKEFLEKLNFVKYALTKI